MLGEKLHPSFPYTKADVQYAVVYEMAETLEDVLARRTRMLFLDAAAAMQVAETVAKLMATILGQSEEWIAEQYGQFTKLAQQYLLR